MTTSLFGCLEDFAKWDLAFPIKIISFGHGSAYTHALHIPGISKNLHSIDINYDSECYKKYFTPWGESICSVKFLEELLSALKDKGGRYHYILSTATLSTNKFKRGGLRGSYLFYNAINRRHFTEEIKFDQDPDMFDLEGNLKDPNYYKYSLRTFRENQDFELCKKAVLTVHQYLEPLCGEIK